MKFLIALLVGSASLTLNTVAASSSIPSTIVRVGTQIVAHNSQSYLAVNFKNEPGWHTYWENPGDAGLPTSIEIKKNGKRLMLDALEWPVPTRFIEKDGILSYGYDGEYTRFFRFDPISNRGQTLQIAVKWLACSHICIPGKLDTNFKIRGHGIDSSKMTLGRVEEQELLSRLQSLPKAAQFPEELDIVVHEKAGNLVLYYNISDVFHKDIRKNSNILTPYRKPLLTFKHEKLFHDKQNTIFGKMEIAWDGVYEEPEIPLPKDGNLKKPIALKFLYANPKSGKVDIIRKEIHSFTVLESEKTKVDKFYSLLTSFSNHNSKEGLSSNIGTETNTDVSKPLWLYILLAFIGGLILNVMPCVLPVISLKLFGLLSVREESPKAILKHNLVYTAGILSTFIAMGLVVAALKSTGESIGWGFHLQSPYFIISIILVLLVFTFNLFGMFEFRAPLGSKIGQINLKNNLAGDFFSGIIATVLSTPCSAPFLGTALTFAFTTASITTLLLIFVSVGIGFAFPFIITAFVPDLINILPKPGKWMDNFKKVLGFTLLLAIIWLLDILNSLIGNSLLSMKANILFVLLFFAFYLQKYITKKVRWRLVAFLLPTFMFSDILSSYKENPPTKIDDLAERSSDAGIQWAKWSPEKMKEYKNKGQYVFINFTAKWCFTCKINERLVIHTPQFKKMVDKYDIQLMMGDWTQKSESISNFLNVNGLVGIPAYFIQKPDGSLINLRETITLKKIEEHLKDSQKYCES